MSLKRFMPLVAVIGILLSGCGGSSSDSASTGSTRYLVNNTQTKDIASVAYVSDSNQELLRKNFDCSAQTKCDLRASVDQAGTMLFYDKDGVLISAFIFAEKPTVLEFVKTTNRMMGLYVFDQLKQAYSISPQALSFRLSNFFANYESQDGLADKLEELGVYYQVKVVKQSMPFSNFLSDLNTRLLSGEVLPTGYNIAANSAPWYAFLQNLFGYQLLPNAYAQEVVTNCPAGLSTAFDIGSEILGELVPIPLLGTVMEKAFEMATESCDGSNDQLGNMEVALSEIKATLKLQHKQTTVILDALTDISTKAQFTTIDDLNEKLDAFASSYTTIIDNGRYKTLQEFVKAQGGFEKAYAVPNFQALVKNDISSGLPFYWATLKQVGSAARKDAIRTALVAKCSKGTEARENDIVSTRMDCNLVALEYNTKVAGIMANHALILKDIANTIGYYAQTEEAFIGSAVSKFDKSGASWADQFDSVIKPFVFATLEEVKKGFSGDAQYKGYFRTIAGLDASAGSSSGLEQRLKTLGCTVTMWRVSDSYIEASCPDPAIAGSSYISRVYYKQDQDLVNFSGVLVPRSRLNQSYDKFTYVNFSVGNVPSIAYTIPNAGSTQELSYNLIMNLPSKDGSLFALQQDYSTGTSFTPNTAGSVGRVVNVEKALSFDYDRVSAYTTTNSKLFKVGVRYVDKSNPELPDKAYAWQILLDGQLAIVHHFLYGKMLCISSNCSNGDYRLNFADGPQNVWFGMVADGKSSTDSQTSVFYEINGTLMK